MAIDQIIGEARAVVAAGGDPDWKQLRDRIRALGLGEQELRQALKQLERIGAVHRARASVKPTTAVRPSRAVIPRRRPLETKPTITGNMEVRRGDGETLVWSREAAVLAWEIRVSERPSPRDDYVVRETVELPGDSTSFVLTLGDLPIRVHVHGRDRGGRLVQRAIISGLTRGTWNDRWQRRATAS
jgi:hypothetical protein